MLKIATIAGSDASGGAGLEADLKTFEEYGLYGMAAVTLIATMDPDNNWTHKVFPVGEDSLRSQLETVFKGVGAEAVKTGMLGTFYAVDLAREYISQYKIKNYVLDPVMVCKGAGEALNPELNAAVEQKLLPLAEVATPNLFEAEQLSGLKEISGIEQMKEAAKIIHGKGARSVFIKAGPKLAQRSCVDEQIQHALAPINATVLQDGGLALARPADGGKLRDAAESNSARAVDILYNGKDFTIFEEDLIKTTWTHGAGCTTSAAIASGLARGLSVLDAVALAKKFITESLKAGFALNQWVGPGNPSNWRKNRLFDNL
jgi:pyridoxine kinase